ncbi:bifunctional diaminohydroxyphosphoribosylaminopyrimidine deaminase/5-amino-6-(5-phosphoribosylamino)uracil reductase RibD [Clostridium sp. 'deep sea']|uniref:bifunctional diaminohydroxyphosphoribosylaminopyrimidine deaminase/5-amino-6-(5-phosphoribosylamino)uracil reductase RibD n=1 Tax=Clostridium sp. 'deep sea' TaxID=2779445 RepID=UPI001896A32D|nr:bifunctional diaminohydroxyphosphoribosylaminopyrimidine deaminase/5-amino-6-(5-phosphoribosylamino)uracil reductase RibD [Clostridium sp. 'deep sea']QOR35473.1 bifunctional diaminohydroxyphosphoribosylaminopyrimidine deaminase/5-amino-6-(5-phosphoribosylamino)uracil reductase RibD [Clostridium sp. 'deep sea']
MLNHELYMKRAFELAELGAGFVSPNPLVGAVIVKNDSIIGEGYHQKYGGLHAEINALNSAVKPTKGATLYVTVEPCTHYGKTPPCCEAIINAGIKQVYIGIIDPNPLTSGKGIQQLQKAGVKVSLGLLETEIMQQNEVFLKYIVSKQPFCTIKYAMTIDGKIASSTGDSKWISSEEARQYAHELRHKNDAILIGIGTVKTDNPKLTTRLKNKKAAQCKRVIVDTKASIPLDSQVLADSNCIIATTVMADKLKLELLKSKGVRVIICPSCLGGIDLKFLFSKLGKLGIASILVEGGSRIITSVIKNKLCDKLIAFISPKIIGGCYSPIKDLGISNMQQSINLKSVKYQFFNNNIAVIGYLK